MATELFEKNILELNFSFLTEKQESGIILTNNFEKIDSKIASPEILFSLETAKNKFNADAVYFRYGLPHPLPAGHRWLRRDRQCRCTRRPRG